VKTQYLIALLFVILISVAALWISIEFSFPIEYAALIPSTVALVIAIFSLSLADPKPKTLPIKALVWSRNHDDNNMPRNIIFYVKNNGNTSLIKPIFHFKAPKKIFKIDRSRKDQKYEIYEYAQTLLAINNQFEFLGTDQGDSIIKFDHSVDLSDWNTGNIYFSVHCPDYKVKTFTLRKDQLPDLKLATSKKSSIKLSEK